MGAVDGNTAGNWNQGSVMHTCNNANPWWKVDLGRGETQITHVVVTSRTDCCNDRLRNTDLEILNASGTVVASRPFEGDKDVHHFRLGNNVMGRYVKLNKHESGVLNIAEVEVFGTYVAPSAAPSVSLLPTVDEPRTVIREAAGAVVATRPFEGVEGNKIHHFTFPNVVGRSVRLNKHESGVLNIAEVEVFGW